MAYDKPVAESNVVLDSLQEDATRLEAGELAEYIRGKLNLAVQLACEGERERRSGHWESAEGYKCRWGEVMAQVKRLLLVLRNRGVSPFGRESVRLRQEQPARSESGGRTPLAEKVRRNGGTFNTMPFSGRTHQLDCDL